MCFNKRDVLNDALDDVEAGSSDRAAVEAMYGPIKTWCFDGISDFSELLRERFEFNEDISGLDVSQVTDMAYMFREAGSFSGDISGWDVSKQLLPSAETFLDGTSRKSPTWNSGLQRRSP